MFQVNVCSTNTIVLRNIYILWISLYFDWSFIKSRSGRNSTLKCRDSRKCVFKTSIRLKIIRKSWKHIEKEIIWMRLQSDRNEINLITWAELVNTFDTEMIKWRPPTLQHCGIYNNNTYLHCDLVEGNKGELLEYNYKNVFFIWSLSIRSNLIDADVNE